MTYLSRLAKLGGAKETEQYTYLAPTFSIPFTSANYENMITPLRDQSIRANDTVLQGLQQGTRHSTWDMNTNAYADIIGNWFAAMIGPDTVTPGVSTTLAASAAAGDDSISCTASIPADSTIMLGTGPTLCYAVTGTPNGTGPYTIPLTNTGGLLYAQESGATVVSQATHLFTQNRTFSTVWPTYSFTVDDGADQLGWPGCVCSELAIKIDPKGFVTLSPKWLGMPATTEATFSYAASQAQPVVGWAWTVQNAGASSTRGLTMDITLKRAVEAIAASTGQQAPRDIFPGALEADGTYKTIFDSLADMNLYEQYTQEPTVHTLSQPVASGGAILAVTMSKSGYSTGKRDLGQEYVQASYSLSGISNTTDASAGGVAQVSLQNFVQAAY